MDLRPRIDLRAIAGLRNRISHEYEGIDWSIAEDVVFTEIPKLVDELDAVMRERGIEPKPIGQARRGPLDRGGLAPTAP